VVPLLAIVAANHVLALILCLANAVELLLVCFLDLSFRDDRLRRLFLDDLFQGFLSVLFGHLAFLFGLY